MPHFARSGRDGEEAELTLELKMIADIGLVGYPNVGKSTLLTYISSARPKIANYHFTTLSPNLGVVTVYDKRFVVEVHLNSNVIGEEIGKSKKEAEQMAAKQALELMGYET